MPKKVRFGENLKIYRSKNQLSQEKLAEQLHVTRQTISAWEVNIGKPDIYILAAISELFDESTEVLLFGKIQEHSYKNKLKEELYEETVMGYIRGIKKKGYYDITEEDIGEFFPIIFIPFVRIMSIALELKKTYYNVVTLYGNGFGIYFETDEEASSFASCLYNIIDNFIHCDEGHIAVNYANKLQSRIDQIETTIVEETRKEIFGDGDFNSYWVDENDRIRGYGNSPEECKKQAQEQECTKYTILN